ncbi:unnamed protein product [Durusdinium trenchii]|uniref:Uncharacterized protein n=2 Tax=Durusdinium trenchii TaxID=1381693 RepID=A0ABP0QVV4_9DINO
MATTVRRERVHEWVHATSPQNFRTIRSDGHLKGNHCQDEYFDGDLCLPGAPMGTWFNANNYRGRTITKTPYPEPFDGAMVTALAISVPQLLNLEEVYHLFKVTERPREYLQVKYAIVKESDACFDWFANHLDPVYDNTDEFVRLYLEDGNYQWCARDAVHKVMVSVFVVNNDDRHPSISVGNCRDYPIEKLPARQIQSPGKLVRQ